MCNIIFGVPQGSILGPILFNIYINDIFFFLEKAQIANFADDTTPYVVGTSIDILTSALEADANILNKWFSVNYLKLNTDKCHLLISNHIQSTFVSVGNDIECQNEVKLLGVVIDNKLNFHQHVTNMCKKANQKLHALARISKFINNNKLRIVMKAFIESQFAYCPLI